MKPVRGLAVAGVVFACAFCGVAEAKSARYAGGSNAPAGDAAAPVTHAPSGPLPSVADMLKAAEVASPDKDGAAPAMKGPAIATDGTMSDQAPDSNFVQVKSMFYSPDEIKRIHFAISAYIKRTTGHEQDMALDELNFLKQLTGMKVDGKTLSGKNGLTGPGGLLSALPGAAPAPPPQPIIKEYPQFYLSSLAYHTPTDWSVWVNSTKFTQSAPTGADLRVVGISPDRVTLEWKPLVMELVNDVWSRAPSDDAEVDTLHGTVTFTLRPNQTFTSYAMRTVEGKLLPQAVPATALTAENPMAPAPVVKTVAPAPVPANNGPEGTLPDGSPDGVKTDDNTGFYGLLNAYKNIK